MIQERSLAAMRVIRNCRNADESRLMLRLHGYTVYGIDVYDNHGEQVLWLWTADVSYRKSPESISSVYYHLIPGFLSPHDP